MLYPLSYGSEKTDDIQRSTPHFSRHQAYVFRVQSVILNPECAFAFVSLAMERIASQSGKRRLVTSTWLVRQGFGGDYGAVDRPGEIYPLISFFPRVVRHYD
jgi:hypothetical protein